MDRGTADGGGVTFPCICCNRCTARTNDGALWCLDCESLPAETRRAALERHLGMCGEQGWYEPPPVALSEGVTTANRDVAVVPRVQGAAPSESANQTHKKEAA